MSLHDNYNVTVKNKGDHSCMACDHVYETGQPCQGSPTPCKHCCAGLGNQMVYAPQYVIEEMAL